jgi:hypothetical protein
VETFVTLTTAPFVATGTGTYVVSTIVFGVRTASIAKELGRRVENSSVCKVQGSPGESFKNF